jgi:hypothetical protein
MRKWVKYYSRFEDEKLCFFDSPSEDSCSAFVDLGMVTSIKQQHAMSVLDNRCFYMSLSSYVLCLLTNGNPDQTHPRRRFGKYRS